MPNGCQRWAENELPELERFFAGIAPLLNMFARQHNLAIDKYYHQSANWTFRFRNPKGGVGQIIVWMKDDSHVGVVGAWQVADYKNCRMYSKRKASSVVQVGSESLLPILESSFQELLGWTKAQLVRDEQIFEEWRDVPEDDFYRDEYCYPFPT